MNIDFSKIEKTIKNLKKKDPVHFKRLIKKIKQISLCDEISIQHYKNLKHDSSNYKRVHIGSFVLIFQINEKIIIFEYYGHHDKVYKIF